VSGEIKSDLHVGVFMRMIGSSPPAGNVMTTPFGVDQDRSGKRLFSLRRKPGIYHFAVWGDARVSALPIPTVHHRAAVPAADHRHWEPRPGRGFGGSDIVVSGAAVKDNSIRLDGQHGSGAWGSGRLYAFITS
jgi:hypothetical protein